jgi:ABC-type Fe3+/spermidine/putrescine transport system ATPase subunit
VNPLLEVRSLTFQLNTFKLNEVTLTLSRGDYLVLLGQSGCGKSTLLKAIAGWYPVPRGAVVLNGDDTFGRVPHLRRVGYVAQTLDLFPHLNVEDNIRFGLKYSIGAPNEKRLCFERIVDAMELAPLLQRSITRLSGGEASRVAIARCLVTNPRLLLLDEPLSGIDEPARPSILRTLRMIHDELGIATIHVTHDREEARHIGQRCAVMRAGRIEQVGTVTEVFESPASAFVAAFLDTKSRSC